MRRFSLWWDDHNIWEEKAPIRQNYGSAKSSSRISLRTVGRARTARRRFPGFGPGCRCDLFDLAHLHVWQPAQDISQVFVRVNAQAMAAPQHRVNHGATPPGGRVANKEKVLFADGGGSNRV